MAKSPWSLLSADEREHLLVRHHSGEDVAVLAAEIGMNPSTLDRRLREISQYSQEEMHDKARKSGKGKQARYRTPDYPQVQLKAAIFDIETTSFVAGGPQSHLVCMSILPLDAERPTTYSITFKDHRDDRRVLKESLEALAQFDIIIGHYIHGYDLPWLLSRLAYFGRTMPRSWVSYDTYAAARRIGLKDGKSLGNLGAYFGIEGVKTRIFRPDWLMVDSPFEADFNRIMEEIVYHCEEDVMLNRHVFYALYQYDPKPTFQKTKW